MKKLRAMVLIVGVCLLGSIGVYAQESSQPAKLNSEISTLEDVESKESITVEVIYNEYGETFIENIILDDGTRLKDHDYTIVYNKTSNLMALMSSSSYPIGDYFHYAAWINRDGLISLSVDPTQEVRRNSSEKNRAWGVLSHTRQGFGSDRRWDNTQVMKWQFDCHFSFAKNKDYWNLEPSRTAPNYAYVLAKGCNP